MRFTASLNTTIPNVGELTNSIVTIDEHFYNQGNTDLEPYYFYYANLNYKFVTTDGKFYLAPSVSYSYFPNKNMPILRVDGDNFIQRITSIDDIHSLSASIALNYKPVQWLVIQPFYNYEYLIYQTPNQEVKHNLHNEGISVQFLPKNWQIVINGNMPMTLVNGDLYSKLGFNMNALVLYKYKSLSFGLEYVYNPNPSKVYTDIQGFSYSEATKWNNFKNLISLKFTYYMYKGKSRYHVGKRINNTDKDSGLTESNTAK